MTEKMTEERKREIKEIAFQIDQTPTPPLVANKGVVAVAIYDAMREIERLENEVDAIWELHTAIKRGN